MKKFNSYFGEKNLVVSLMLFLFVYNSLHSIENKNSFDVSITERYFIFDIIIQNTKNRDMIIPLFEWVFNGRIRYNEPVYVFGQFKTINGITYIGKNANQNLYLYGGMWDGEFNYATEIIPKFMVIHPGQTKILEIQIEKIGVLPDFFEQDEYNIEIEMAVADNEILNEFNTIFKFDYKKYVVDSEIYKLKLNQHKKYKHYFTSKEHDSKKKFDDCLKNVFYLAFRNHITIKGELILKK